MLASFRVNTYFVTVFVVESCSTVEISFYPVAVLVNKNGPALLILH